MLTKKKARLGNQEWIVATCHRSGTKDRSAGACGSSPRFSPAIGKLNFYLEALDRDARKLHENPAIGLLLCASIDSEVVEYALSRTLSPALSAEYRTQLPDIKESAPIQREVRREVRNLVA